MNDMTKVHAEYWKTINDLSRDKTVLLERIKWLEEARTVAAANSLTTMLAYEDAIAKINRLEEELMEVKNKYAVLVADVVLRDDQVERIKRLEEALEGTVKWFVDLADSGDAGFWNPEEQSVIIKARAALEACGWKPPKCDRIGGCLKENGARSGFVWSCKCDTDKHDR